MSTNGASTNVGGTSASVGDFTILLNDINPTLSVGGFPETWTQFSAVLSGVGASTSGPHRLSLRGARHQLNNGNYIGIDTVRLSTVPEPSTVAVLALGLALLGWRLRRANAR